MVFDKLKSIFFKESDEEEFDLEYEDFEEEAAPVKVKKRAEVEKLTPLEKDDVKEPSISTTTTVMSDITVDVIVEGEQKAEPRLKKYDRSKDFVMPQVISPINGLKDEEISQSNYVHVSTKKQKDSFGAVISPFYGDDYEVKKTTPVTTASDGNDSYEADEDALSLDDILEKDEASIDEIIQFSLFGDAMTIRDDKEEDKTDEELPF